MQVYVARQPIFDVERNVVGYCFIEAAFTMD
ncbi:hypothetical protein LR69_04380 [Geobacillus sp. BCO2]|nr:hypothetical protein LR69_04380 [Geobacillus sp. BCO2]